MLEQLQGEISRFYAGCVQQRQLSGQSGHKQIKALPDGRQLRYTYNGGQETIDVRLSPKSRPGAPQAKSPEKSVHDFVLAIDVLFESEQHVAGDVTSYTEVVVTPADIRKYYIRDKYTYFDTFKVVGLQVGDLAEGGYAAKSAGSVKDPDNRLKSLTGYPTAKSVERTLTAADAPPNLLGHCFVARPRDNIDPKTVIDVFAATCDIQKTNSYPDGEGSTLAVDDPTFDYAVKQDFRWTIRVREFVDGGPVAIGVTTRCEGETQHFTAPEIEVLPESGVDYVPGYNIPPTVEDAPVVTADARTSSWAFAALSAWEDTGDNTDPTLGSSDPEAKLGKLLDELSGSSTITGPEPLERKLLDAPAWEQPVEEMTKIATITWTPSLSGGRGKATIEVA